MSHVSISVDALIALKRFVVRPRTNMQGAQLQQYGQHRSKHRNRGMDFSDVRHYHAGDEIRHMAWRMTARSGKPHVKMYTEEKERPLVMVVDFAPSMFFGTRVRFKSVAAAELAALIGWISVRQGDRVGGLLSNGVAHHEYVPRAREAGLLPFLRGLALLSDLQYQHTAGISEGLQHLVVRAKHIAKPGSTIVLISDFYNLNTEVEKQLTRLRAHNTLILYAITDILEQSPPPAGYYPVAHGQEGFWINTRQHSMARAYQATCDAHQARIQSLAQALHADCFLVRTDYDLPALAHLGFRKTYAS